MASDRGEAQQGFMESNNELDEPIQLKEKDIRGGLKACFNSLVGRLFADKAFSVGTMESALRAIWEKTQGFRVIEVGHNKFQFFFEEEMDLMRIEKGSPRQTMEVARKLGDRVGRVLEVDFFNVKRRESRILKTKVEINYEKKIKDNLKVTSPDNNTTGIVLRADQVGSRVEAKEKSNQWKGKEARNGDCFRKKKPTPDCLIERLSGLNFKDKEKDKENNSNPKVAHQGNSEKVGLSITSHVINQVHDNSTRIPIPEIDKSTTNQVCLKYSKHEEI
ncbi:hypothetical protein PIB30_064554 [Stylosanthes scabra]|uniref:DUF4283 domain-containing protein n=1 Tax=Stylosanthes scabra TaxID=79078 RepID=A0ABU6YPC7_9FABA|nr:hypothetical protein [Stylosanthes scabra]